VWLPVVVAQSSYSLSPAGLPTTFAMPTVDPVTFMPHEMLSATAMKVVDVVVDAAVVVVNVVAVVVVVVVMPGQRRCKWYVPS